MLSIYVIDKVFRDKEHNIGIQNLIKLSAGDKVFSSPSSSIHTLGLIAISKLLSPSHTVKSAALYNEYTSWMESNNIKYQGFPGFVSNRFGRIAELAKEFMKRGESVI